MQPRFRPALAALTAVLVGCATLGLLGRGVEDRLDPLSLTISGTESARGEALARSHFGDASQFAVLLRGPSGAIDRQGPRLVKALRRSSTATVISPWDRGTLTALRPGPRKALVIVDYHVPLATAIKQTVPALDRLLERRVRPPLRASESGFATVSRGLQHETIAATERAELLAVPLLVIVLLIVFRSVVAAAIPLAFGALTVVAGRGVLVLLSSVMSVDAISLVVCTMMGLALGVDYSLLIVSRFREELANGAAPREAALRSRRTAGRTTVLAGSTLLAALLFSALFQPGTLLLSLAVTVGVATVLSVLVAVGALPGLLGLLGHRVNSLAIPIPLPVSAGGRGGTVALLAGRVLRRPALASIAIAVPLLLLAAPAIGLSTAAPGVDELPATAPARVGAEAIADAVGPGWEAPFVLVAAAKRGPITTPGRLATMARMQRRIAAEPGVRAVIGPAPIERGAKPLRRFGRTLRSPALNSIDNLAPGLHEAADAVSRLRRGLADGAAGSSLLGTGASRAEAGAGLLAEGLDRAAGAGREAGAGIGKLSRGAGKLEDAEKRAAVGSLTLKLGLHALYPTVRGSALARSRRLARKLERVAKEDPSLEPTAREMRTLTKIISAARNEVRRLRGVADEVNGGLGRISKGGGQLSDGVERLDRAASGLTEGLDRLGSGARQLSGGLSRLSGGADALEAGLAEGYRRSRPLEEGLQRSAVKVSAVAGPLASGARRLRRTSPGLFDSGYFVLSAVEGAPPRQREIAGEAVSVRGGGQAARMLVISDEGLNSAGSKAIGARLRRDASQLRQRGLLAGVGGGAAVVNDYGEVTRSRIPLVVASVVLACFLMLVIILRAPLLAAIAVLLNLASVGAAIGVMALVCKLPDGVPLGGHPYVDTVGAAAIFGVTFGLSIDYAVFLLTRMREGFLASGDGRQAIRFGLEKTAGVITGAAAIMAAVFVSFATASVATVSQMGIGLTVAIVLDATVVRIVLLPALMMLVGDRVWHTPAWLERALPKGAA